MVGGIWRMAGLDIPEKGSELFDSHLVGFPRSNNGSENDVYQLENHRLTAWALIPLFPSTFE